MMLVASKLAFTYIYNEHVIGKYEDGDYDINMKPAMMCNVIQPYIAHYNKGNIYYQNGDYNKAIEEYNLAIDMDSKKNHKCDIRVNKALAMLKTLPEDYDSQENIENTIEVLNKAKEVLVEKECAKIDEDGHDEDATKLREEIDAMLKNLEQGNGSGDGDDDDEKKDDPQSKPDEKDPAEEREQQIKEQLQQQQNNAYKDRYEDNMFYEELPEDIGDYMDGPIW